jgi:histidinol-phosphatase
MTDVEFGPHWSASFARGSERDLRAWLDFALTTAAAADAIALRWFRRDVEIATKPDRTYVTAADREIERLVRTRLADRFPAHGIVGEEYGTEAGAGEFRWIIDPIDGTANFVRGVRVFATLLALERDGELQAAVVSAPAMGERWFAARGLGAWGEDGPPGRGTRRRLAVSRIASLADSQVVYGAATDVQRSGRAPGFGALLDDVWRDRGFGDYWGYCLVAEGAAEAMVEADLKIWDLAAPALLVEEAGGRITDLDGVRRIDGGTVLATNGLLHDEVLERLARTR